MNTIPPVSFDGTKELARALRDLIALCELTMGTGHDGIAEEQAILSRAQEGFTTLRNLFGDSRAAEDIAFAKMVEPPLPLPDQESRLQGLMAGKASRGQQSRLAALGLMLIPLIAMWRWA